MRAGRNFLVLSALPGEGAVGVGTSKKIGCHARRNRVKRRIREAARSLHSRLEEWDSVVIAKASAAEAGLEELKDEFSELIDELERRWEKQ